MNSTPRIKLICKCLLEETDAISVVKLAQCIGVSKRTVQRELEYVPKVLKRYNLSFASKTGVGVWIEGSEEDRQILLQEVLQDDAPDVSDREYRRKSLTLELLKEKGLKKLFWYSSKFQVSEATISADLDVLEKWFNKYDLTISRKPGSGICVEGIEKNYRKAISAFISQNIDAKVMSDAYDVQLKELKVYNQFKNAGITQMLGEDVLKRVVNALNGMEDNHHITSLTESSYIALIMHISIAVNRILCNETIKTKEKWVEQFNSDEDYTLAQKIAFELEEEFEITIPEIEISYICLHIKASKHDKIDQAVTKNLDMQGRKLQSLVNDMIYAFDSEKAYELKQDDEFLQGLLAHLQPTIVRLAYNMKIHNPILEQIKVQYPDMYNRCEKVAFVMSERLGLAVPPEEIGFITVHFGAAVVRLEEKKQRRRVVNIAVICSSGIGVSRLMSTKLKKIFKDRISLTALAKRELDEEVLAKNDFLISSIPLQSEKIQVLEVNPLLSDTDIESIRQAIRNYEKAPIKSLIKDKVNADLESMQILATNIKNLMLDFKLTKLDSKLSLDEILDQTAQIIADEETSKKQIKHDILQREKMSTQIFAEFGFALLHARTSGVTQPYLGVFLTENLGSFKHESMKQIKVVFMMLIPKDENMKLNSEMLGSISTSLVEDETLLDLILADDEAQVKSKFTRVLKNFFLRYLTKLDG
ncbi:MAG: BglG family transcription antiterminator [Clostridia bacterium]